MRLACWAIAALTAATVTADVPDLWTEEFERFTRQAESSVEELRLEAVQGFSWLKTHRAEPCLLKLAADESPRVRQEVAFTLSRVGRRDSIPVLIRMLDDTDVGVRQHAAQSLRTLTQLDDPMQQKALGTKPDEYEATLLAALKGEDPALRARALKALRCFAGPTAEAALLEFVASAKPAANGYEQALAILVLERVGTEASLEYLEAMADKQPLTAWALGEIGGERAEAALRKGLGRFQLYDPQFAINLDRLHSTNCAQFVPLMVGSYGCITYRGQPENLMYDATPLQQACTNLIIRSGRGPEVVDCVLEEMEGCGTDEEIAEDIRPLMIGLREELKPGFVRNDGLTTSQPMCAMWHIIRDRTLAPRLVPLLQHPAFVARIYAAMSLGQLGAEEGLPAIADVVDEGYPFADAVTLTSGKHFGYSQTVRWRSFLCMAVGRMGGERARAKLEAWAMDEGQYRDIRYGSVVGLGFIGSEESLPALEGIAEEDIIWRIRVEAEDVGHGIEMARTAG